MENFIHSNLLIWNYEFYHESPVTLKVVEWGVNEHGNGIIFSSLLLFFYVTFMTCSTVYKNDFEDEWDIKKTPP